MIVRLVHQRPRRRVAAVLSLLVSGAALSGCADMSDSMATAFADPAKYELYDCRQLQTERKALATRAAELQGLMAKANTGAAGPVVAELAYRNDYVAVRGQAKFAEEAWQRDKCHEMPDPVAEVKPEISPAGDKPKPPVMRSAKPMR